MLEIVESGGSPALLKVFGVGGGGSNAVNRMIQAGLKDVEFWVSNTDLQALELSPCHNRLPIGKNTTRGLGAGGDPEVGRLSAEEDAAEIEAIIEGADMVFITAGMGGGTGTGAAPVIARIARELGVLTVGIVTKPFSFEGKKKLGRAKRGLEALAEQVDTLIAIPNDKLMQIVAPGTSFDDALLMADDVLLQATRGISDLIMGHGIINLDFADVRTVMRGRGNALLGSGTAAGDGRALEAAQKAVSSPLLEDLAIGGAEAVLVNIQGGPGMGFHEAAQAAQFVSDQVGEEADVFWGAVVDPNMEDEIRVTLVATGFPEVKAAETADVRTQQPTRAEAARGHAAASHGNGTDADDPRAIEAEEWSDVLAEDELTSREGNGDGYPRDDSGWDRHDDDVIADHGRGGEGRDGRSREFAHEAHRRPEDRMAGVSGAEAHDPEFDRMPSDRVERPVPADGRGSGRDQDYDRNQDYGRDRDETSAQRGGREEVRSSRDPERAAWTRDPREAASGRYVEQGRNPEREAQAARAEEGGSRGGNPSRPGRNADPRVSEGQGRGGRDGRQQRPADPRDARGEDRRAARPAEGGRLPERERRGPADSIAFGASGLESELFLPKDRDTSDPGLRKSRWASSDPEFTDAEELDRPSTKRRPLDVPTYLRKRMD